MEKFIIIHFLYKIISKENGYALLVMLVLFAVVVTLLFATIPIYLTQKQIIHLLESYYQHATIEKIQSA